MTVEPTPAQIEAELLFRTAQRERAVPSTLLGVVLVLALTWATGSLLVGLAFTGLRMITLLLNGRVCHQILAVGGAASLEAGLDRRLMLGVAGTGVAWGLVVRAIHTAATWSIYDLQLIVLMVMVSTLMLITTSHLPRFMLAFNGAMWSTVIALILAKVGPSEWVMGVMVLWGVLVLYGQQLHQQSYAGVVADLRSKLLANELQRLLGAALELASRDPLTLALNRRAFLEQTTVQAASMRRYGEPSALLLIDIDHFKGINDAHGHLAGDEVLRVASKVMASALRPSDVLARWGGEEFLILLPRTEAEAACGVGERLRHALGEVTDPQWPPGLTITVSIGVAHWAPGERLEEAIACADRALYAAKAAGRDRVIRGD